MEHAFREWSPLSLPARELFAPFAGEKGFRLSPQLMFLNVIGCTGSTVAGLTQQQGRNLG